MARFLARRTARIDWRELAQVGVLAMLEAAPRYKEDQGQFWPFVYPRVRGAMLDFLGGLCRETCHVELTGVRLFSENSHERLSMELSIDLERAMKRLTAEERRVFCALSDGHKPAQIAGMLRITPARVSQLRKRANSRLRKELVA
jgi:RNA polymerase sigma factor (sigma-70 family)